MFTCICVGFATRSHYPTFVKQTNSPEPNAEHSSALESAPCVGGAGLDTGTQVALWSGRPPPTRHTPVLIISAETHRPRIGPRGQYRVKQDGRSIDFPWYHESEIKYHVHVM